MKVVGRQAIQEVDRRAAQEYGVPTLVLMENAGAAVGRRAAVMLEGRLSGRRIVVAAGSGNNGGDGLAAARRLAAAGAHVLVALAAEPDGEAPRLSPDALVNFRIARRIGIEVQFVGGEESRGRLAAAFASADLVIDAVLGTGSRGAPRGRALEAIEMVAACGRPVLAVDIPSGVDSDTGQMPGAAVKADETVTFGLPKPGHLLFPGAGLCGAVWVAEIGFPPPLLEGAPAAFELVEAEQVRSWLPARPAHGHKGTFGHVLVVAGSRGMVGAGAMASRGALAAGAGLVTWAVPACLQDTAAGLVPEALTAGLPDEAGRGRLAATAAGAVMELLATREVLLIGPGLGTHPETAAAVLEILQRWPGPAVIDADALNILAVSGPAAVGGPQRILTPHPGEMARLLGRSVAAVQEDRLAAAREAAEKYASVVVLKGARTAIADPQGRAWLNPAAEPSLATGGSGDVLAGIAAGLLAQGARAAEAAAGACFIHALAGVMAAGGGDVGITAAGIAASVGPAIRALKRGDPVPEGLAPVRVLAP